MSSVPAVPEGAPQRPGSGGLVGETVGLLVAFSFILVLDFHPVFGYIGVLGLCAALAYGVGTWTRYEKHGWYYRREIVVPELPFVLKKRWPHIIFEDDALRVESVLQSRKIFYDQIQGVRVYYVERDNSLHGLNIFVLTKKYYKIGEAPPKEPVWISDDGDGKKVQLTLAILRKKAPQAEFRGPMWLEEGWVPHRSMVPAQNVGGGGG